MNTLPDTTAINNRNALKAKRYDEQRTTIAAQAARIAELEQALKNLLTMCVEHPAVYDGTAEIKAAREALKG